MERRPHVGASTSGRPEPERVRLSCRRRRRRDDPRRRRLVDPGRAGARTGEVDYGYLVDDADEPLPDPRSRRQPARRARPLAHLRPHAPSPGPTTPGPDASSPGRSIYELHLGTFTPEGTLDAAAERLDHLVAPRCRPGRAAAGERLQRHPQLGLRRRPLVGRRRGVRRPRGVPALRRRRPRRRARRDPGRRAQPPRTVRQLPAGLRALPEDRGRERLGLLDQPRRRGVGGGTPLHPRQRADVVHRPPRRRRCASTPCTRSPTSSDDAPARGDGRSRWARCRRTCADRSR